jgi:hypothetical protein
MEVRYEAPKLKRAQDRVSLRPQRIFGFECVLCLWQTELDHGPLLIFYQLNNFTLM